MKITELERLLDIAIPRELSCEWDNDGRMLLPEPDRELSRVLIALDVTKQVIDEAIQGEYDLILTHHPFIFRPLRAIDSKSQIALIRAGVAVYSYHTRLDSAQGGVNDCLADAIGLSECTCFGEDGMGRIGTLSGETDAEAFAEHLKNTLHASRITAYDAGKPIRRVAVLGGAGKDFIADAIKAGADAFVTGEAGYNTLLDAEGGGMSIFCAGHYETEFPVCRALAAWVKEAIPEAQIRIMDARALKEL